MPLNPDSPNEIFDILFEGFPGKSERGFLGWSTAVLMKQGSLGLFDTAGMNERIELITRLRSRQVQLEDISFVILSHFHFDHASNFSLFPNATVYLHELEVRHVLENPTKDLAIPIELFHSLRESDRLEILRGEHGSVEGYRWFHTPGHTLGSISLSVQHRSSTWVFAADALKNIVEAKTGEVWMTTDPIASTKSISKIVNEADWIVPGHDRLLRIDHATDPPGIEAIGKGSIKIEMPAGYPVAITAIAANSESENFLSLELG